MPPIKLPLDEFRVAIPSCSHRYVGSEVIKTRPAGAVIASCRVQQLSKGKEIGIITVVSEIESEYCFRVEGVYFLLLARANF